MIFNITQDNMRELVLEWIDPLSGIMELGCSSGNFAILLKKNGIKNYVGIDILKYKIKEAKLKIPDMNFICCDIIKNLHILKDVNQFVSFQCLEHIKEDLKVLNAFKKGAVVILSVPNSPYKGHVRWFELEGWKKRFSEYIDFDDIHTIQHPTKPKKRSFLFKGVRNGNKD